MKSNLKRLSLICPCHNEAQAIPVFLPKILNMQKHLITNGILDALDIVIINDGSTDSSQKLLESYQPHITLINLAVCKGYGYAIKQGLKCCKEEWVAFCDLDNTYQPKDLQCVIEYAQNHSVQMVWGNRLHTKSHIPWIRYIGNTIYKYLIFLFSLSWVSDPCSGFRLFYKNTFQQILSFPDDLSFSLALTIYCIKKKIPFKIIDIHYKERLGRSKLIPFKDGLLFLYTLLKVFLIKKV